jgi:hypothetical protein
MPRRATTIIRSVATIRPQLSPQLRPSAATQLRNTNRTLTITYKILLHKNVASNKLLTLSHHHRISSSAAWITKILLWCLLVQLLMLHLTLAVIWSRILSDTSIFSKRYTRKVFPFESSTSNLFVATNIFGCHW